MVEVIIGRNPLLEALKAGRPISKILLEKSTSSYSPAKGKMAEIVLLAQAKRIPVEYVERAALDWQSSTGAHQGVVAYAASKEYVTLADLLSLSREKNEPPFYLVLDGIEDPHNLGAILRTAEAAGVHGVIVRSRRAVGLTPAVVKASAGAVEYVPVARVANIAQAVELLKKNNVWVVGLDRAGDLDYARVDYRPATAIVIGGEGRGLSDLVRKRCDCLASIPMRGRITSLNASVAAAVVMYEVLRQRSGQSS
ncbi:MAG TPA: 23S rRNA (guanosine(2251)-2'-O)-methyltransferase RlmB [Dehalococcoidales bacterium]